MALIDDALIDSAHRAMLDPTSTQRESRMVRTITYVGNRRPSTDDRWWIDEHAVSDKEQEAADDAARAEIASEPGFKSSFLMGFGDPGHMLRELVVPPQTDGLGAGILGTGAYVGPQALRGAQIAPLKYKPLTKMGKQEKNVPVRVAVDPIRGPPPRPPRPSSARRAPRSVWETMLKPREPPRPSTAAGVVVAAAFQATRRAQIAAGDTTLGRSEPVAVRGFGGNPLSLRRNERAHGESVPAGQDRAALGPLGRYEPHPVPKPQVAAWDPQDGMRRSQSVAAAAARLADGGLADAAPPATPKAEGHAQPATRPSTAGGNLGRGHGSSAAWLQQRELQRAEELSGRPALPTQRTNRRDPFLRGSRRLSGTSLRPSTSSPSYMQHTRSSAAFAMSRAQSPPSPGPAARNESEAALLLRGANVGWGMTRPASAGRLRATERFTSIEW